MRNSWNWSAISWSRRPWKTRSRKILIRAFDETDQIARQKKVSMRTAAYILGIQRVAKAMELRGIYP
jgi:glutamate dehydrogenase (NAD(P)+)